MYHYFRIFYKWYDLCFKILGLFSKINLFSFCQRQIKNGIILNVLFLLTSIRSIGTVYEALYYGLILFTTYLLQVNSGHQDIVDLW